MKRIAILAGGFDAERVISLKSAKVVQNNLNPTQYQSHIIDIGQDKWESTDGHIIDKNDFSLTIDHQTVHFDACFMAIHGAPVENGQIQGYLEMLHIPYTGCDGRTMAITMDKILTKQILSNTYQIPTARFIVHHRKNKIDTESILQLGLPLFIKPNSVGSSFGVTKVKSRDQIIPAIEEALMHDDTVLIEEFIEGREFSHGVLMRGKDIHVLPITEIIPENEFFDYAAKYEGKSQEVTPADIPKNIEETMYALTQKIFQAMNCRDMSRVDYLVRGDEVYFMEINTIPGLSEASIYPQQLAHYGFSLAEAFDIMLQNAMTRK